MFSLNNLSSINVGLQKTPFKLNQKKKKTVSKCLEITEFKLTRKKNTYLNKILI